MTAAIIPNAHLEFNLPPPEEPYSCCSILSLMGRIFITIVKTLFCCPREAEARPLATRESVKGQIYTALCNRFSTPQSRELSTIADTLASNVLTFRLTPLDINVDIPQRTITTDSGQNFHIIRRLS